MKRVIFCMVLLSLGCGDADKKGDVSNNGAGNNGGGNNGGGNNGSENNFNNPINNGGQNNGLTDIAEQPLQGVINGQGWQFISGKAFIDSSDDTVSISLYDQELDSECGNPIDFNRPSILFFRDAIPENGALSLQSNVTFAYRDGETSQNDVATTGAWRIDSIGDGIVEGGLSAATQGHEVNGVFSIPLCPNPFEN